MSAVSAFLLCLMLASANCQIPDGCVDCGLPDHPNCGFGKCTETCSWCKLLPEEVAELEDFRTQLEMLHQMR